jgi:trk system potassium uptake protein TrkA
MKIVIIGIGEIGYLLAEFLLTEGHDLALVENNEEKLKYARAHLDAQILRGDGANALVLEPIVDEHTDIVICATDSDATNVVATLISRKFGAKRVIARISNSANLIHPLLTDDPGVSVINAEMIVSRELARLVGNTHADDVEFFASGKAEMIRVHVDESSCIANKRIKDIDLPKAWQFIARIREGDFTIASGTTELKPGDQILLVGNPDKVKEVESLCDLKSIKVRRVILVGSDAITINLAKALVRRNIEVRLIVKDSDRAAYISGELDKALVFHGDGTSDEILEQAGISETDYFLALTDDDENNVLLSLVAKEKKVERVIALALKPQYKPIIEKMGIDLVLNPRAAMVDEIVRNIHRNDLSAITILEGGKGRMIEIVVQKETKFVGVPLSELKLPKQMLVGGVIRNGELIIPRGHHKIQMGDHILIFTTGSAVAKIKGLFA